MPQVTHTHTPMFMECSNYWCNTRLCTYVVLYVSTYICLVDIFIFVFVFFFCLVDKRWCVFMAKNLLYSRKTVKYLTRWSTCKRIEKKVKKAEKHRRKRGSSDYVPPNGNQMNWNGENFNLYKRLYCSWVCVWYFRVLERLLYENQHTHWVAWLDWCALFGCTLYRGSYNNINVCMYV